MQYTPNSITFVNTNQRDFVFDTLGFLFHKMFHKTNHFDASNELTLLFQPEYRIEPFFGDTYDIKLVNDQTGQLRDIVVTLDFRNPANLKLKHNMNTLVHKKDVPVHFIMHTLNRFTIDMEGNIELSFLPGSHKVKCSSFPDLLSGDCIELLEDIDREHTMDIRQTGV